MENTKFLRKKLIAWLPQKRKLIWLIFTLKIPLSKMFTEVIDNLLVQWYGMYTDNKEKIENDDEFNTSKERKKMDEFIEAVVILRQSKTGYR
jgi:hypothetical protein